MTIRVGIWVYLKFCRREARALRSQGGFSDPPDKLNQARPTDLETHPHEASTKVEEVPAEKC